MRLLRSLNSKLLLIVVSFVIGSGIYSAYHQSSVEENLLLERHYKDLRYLSDQFSEELAEELFERYRIITSVHKTLTPGLVSATNIIDLASFDGYPRSDDGAVRMLQSQSGVYIPRSVSLDETKLSWLAYTERFWDGITPPMSSMFDSFYLVTVDGSSRVYPKERVLTKPAEYDGSSSELEFAGPKGNPGRDARWAPAYFDHEQQRWVLSLLMPIYINGEYFAVLGGDVDLSYFLSKLEGVESLSANAEALVFDDFKRVVLSQGHEQSGSSTIDGNSVPGNEASGQDDWYRQIIEQVATGEIQSGSIFDVSSSQHKGQAIYRDIPNSEWGLLVYFPRSDIDAEVLPIRQSIYTTTLWLAVFLSVVLFLSLRLMVTRRISQLALATSNVGREGWALRVPASGSDELGVLGRSINSMLAKIDDLIGGLNDNIARLEAADLESRKLTGAIEHSSNAVVILNADGQQEYGNRRFWEVSGFQRDKGMLGLRALLLPSGESLETFWQEINFTLQQSDEWRGEYQAQGAEGNNFWLMQSISVIRDDSGSIQYYICAARDISANKEQQEEVERLAYYDQLTGLQNRVLFKSQLLLALRACEREGNQIALLYLDLDHFKRVNDTLGHEAGDHLLIEVAERLKGCLREEDSVARLGGDEFAILLNRIGSPQFASIVANKVITALSREFLIAGQEVNCRASVGITLAPIDSNDIDVLMKNADMAMYQAKEKGRNSFQFYTSDMNLEVASRLQLEREMRHAVERNEFVLYYQPQIDLKTGKIVGAEALIRWNHPGRGMVSPLEFIPLAEESGLIVSIGQWALRSACQQARSIQKGLSESIKISVNISSRQLKENNFTDELRAVFRESKVDPKLIELEVTESVLMDNIESVSKVLKDVRDLGVDIAIDDFGTGYSSLSYLKKLPVSTLKVDREFVRDLPEDMEDRAITSLIVTMANSLNHKVVVEGTETVEQLSFLSEIGCDYAQGFFYCKPIPADELMVLLFEWDAEAALDWGSFKR